LSEFLGAARTEAARLQHDYVGTEHLLLALLQRADPSLQTILAAFSASPDQLRERLERRCPPGKGAPAEAEEIKLRSGARRALDQARAAANGQEPGARQLLGALLTDGRGIVSASLGDLGIPVAKVREALGIERPAPAPRSDAPAGEGAAPRTEPRKAREKQERAPKPERPPKGERPGRSDPRPDRGEQSRGDRAERGTAERPVESPATRPRSGDRRPDGPPRIAPVHQPFFTWRKLPLLAIPVSLYMGFAGGFSPLAVFVAACLAVLPLAGYMGEATEHLTARTGPAFGGFLNATFGNAAELIIAIVALRAGLIDLVKASITGSILGNLLLILGLSLVAGSLKTPIIRFNRTAAGMSAGMLALAVTGLVFPTLFHSATGSASQALVELHLSEAVALVLAVTYGLSLLFSLKTHSRLFAGEPHPMTGHLWSVPVAIGVLALATVGVALESEVLVHAVQELSTEHAWLSQMFLGLIIIPLIGNAAEHATAIVVARKGKMDLALNIAMGSSTQVALLVAPLLVFIGAFMGPNSSGQYMNLVFTPIEVIAVSLSTILTAIVTLDGESHWFEGVQLLALYAMVAIAVFFL
jgi:Ca2+:H+ antiporter